ncbi:MAG: hypothetical protein ACRDYA_20750 [Egibacteraceae bacterium]
MAAVHRTAQLREHAAKAQQESRAKRERRVRSLLDAGLTLRDAGDVLGLSSSGRISSRAGRVSRAEGRRPWRASAR